MSKSAKSFRLPTLSRSLFSVVLSGGALCFAVVVFAGLASLKEQPTQREKVEKVYNVEVFNVEAHQLQELVSGFGTVEPFRDVQISAEVSGNVDRTHPQLKTGEPVQRPDFLWDLEWLPIPFTGDLLVEIDPTVYLMRVAKVRSQLAEIEGELQQLDQEEQNSLVLVKSAQEDYETYLAEYNRVKELRDRNSSTVSLSRLQSVKLQLATYERTLQMRQNEQKLIPIRRSQAQLRRDTLKSELHLADLDVQRAMIWPRFDGVLEDVRVETGEYARVGDPLFRLTEISRVEIPVPVTIAEYSKIKQLLLNGEQPRVWVAESESSVPQWSGRVVRVAPSANQTTRTINVYVQVRNESQNVPLLPGAFVHVLIEGPVLDSVIGIPRDAIINEKVFVAVDGKVEQREIQIEQTTQAIALVRPASTGPKGTTQGLRSGEKLIITNLDMIYDGVKVNLQGQRKLAEELKIQEIPLLRFAGENSLP